MFCCQHCSMLSTILFSIVTPHRRLIQAGSTMLSNIVDKTLNNVKTLFNAVFNDPKQVVRFLLCTLQHQNITTFQTVKCNQGVRRDKLRKLVKKKSLA